MANYINNDVVQNFPNYVSEYCGQGSNHQSDCYTDCVNYVDGWYKSSKTQACTDFYYANGNGLDIQSKLGSHGYRDTGTVLSPDSVNYPLGCGPNSSVLVPFTVMDVIYVPPGCTVGSGATSYNCLPLSTVMYSGSDTGSMQLSIEDSLSNKNEFSLTASSKLSGVGDVLPLSLSITSGYTTVVTQDSSVTFLKTSSFSQTWGTSATNPLSNDGFNHDQDLINAELDAGAIFVTWQNPFNSQQIVVWSPGHKASSAWLVQPFTVSELRCAVLNYTSAANYLHYATLVTLHDSTTGAVIPCVSMGTGLYNTLIKSRKQGGLGATIRDFYEMLLTDEYWGSAYNPIASVDRTRYTPQQYDGLKAMPYDPPEYLGGSDWQCPSAVSQGVMNQKVDETSVKNSVMYDTSYTVSVGDPTFLSDKNEMTWTNTVSQDNKQTGTKSFMVSIGCPSPAWGQNPSDFLFIYAYFDSLYGEYLLAGGNFAPPAEKPYYSGLVIDSTGKALSKVKLELSFDGKTFDAFSDESGRFQFYNYTGKDFSDSVPAELSVPGTHGIITRSVTLGEAGTVLLPAEFLGKTR